MSEHAARASAATRAHPTDLRETVREITGYWWVGLVAGISWLVISLVILQFDSASDHDGGRPGRPHVPARRRPEHRR